MTDKEFTELLTEHADCLRDKKRFKAILNDLFPTEKQTTTVLGNLYEIGIVSDIENASEIGDSLYFNLKKGVVKTFGTDQRIADQMVRMWIMCYGGSVLGKSVNISGSAPAIDGVSGDQTGGQDNDTGSGTWNAPSGSIGIDEYQRALWREKYYLQNEGGRKYKVSNGKRLDSKNGKTTYGFEIEAELYLSDDAPITLAVGTNESEGNVLSCEGFQIVVIVDYDYGETIGQGTIAVEPWKLLEKLAEKMDEIKGRGGIPKKIIEEGPGNALPDGVNSIPKGQDTAIQMAQNNEITVIWGPPGTGKTYTMSQIAIEAIQAGERVLVVSHSNVSVDGVVKAVKNRVESLGKGEMLKQGKILRYGYVRDDELSNDPYAVAYNLVLVNNPRLKEEYDKWNAERVRLKKTNKFHTPEGKEVEEKLKALRKKIRETEKKYAKNASFLATTISKATVDPIFDEQEFDLVMFDEASMAYVPQILCAAALAQKRFVIVGDFLQLPPIAQSEARAVLTKDIFHYLGIGGKTKICAHKWMVMLNVQRRMHPDIAGFVSRHVYQNLLKDYPDVHTNRDHIVSAEPFMNKALGFVDLFGTYCATMKNSDNSRFNILGAIVDFLTALKGSDSGDKTVGVIAPYSAQTRLIRAMIQDYDDSENNKANVACATVHQFQGSERDIIIFDAVESYPSSRAGWLMSKDLVQVKRLVNVAVTRARGKLVLTGNGEYWAQKFDGSQHIIPKLIDHMQENGKTCCHRRKNLTKMFKTLPETKNIKYYPAKNMDYDALKTDIESAKMKIVVSIPDGELDADTQGEILSWLNEAADRGIKVWCKSNDVENLPTGWQAVTKETDNATFPIVMIDDKIMWYGLPLSKGKFTDGTMSFVTVCPVFYRICGEHTLELIKVFSNLELVSRGLYTFPIGSAPSAPISQPAGSGTVPTPISGGKVPSSGGIFDYIAENETCDLCDAEMQLIRSKRGKYFLKCKGCGETAFLTPETLRMYIAENDIKCPIHGSKLAVGLSKMGVYVRCPDSGGHFIEPGDI